MNSNWRIGAKLIELGCTTREREVRGAEGAAQVTIRSPECPPATDGAAAGGGARRRHEREGEGASGGYWRAQELTAELVGETASRGEDEVDGGMENSPAAEAEDGGGIPSGLAFPARRSSRRGRGENGGDGGGLGLLRGVLQRRRFAAAVVGYRVRVCYRQGQRKAERKGK